MFGYMTEQQAKQQGFTHHGSYFGIPIWISDEDCPMVAAKWAPMEYVMTLFHYIEGAMRSMLSYEPSFQFTIKGPIK